MKTLRKIGLMHREFGKKSGTHICKECSNFIPGGYKKCKVYGVSASEATDWANSYEACGMFNKEWNGHPIIRLIKRGCTRVQGEEKPIDGQVNFMEVGENA